MDGAGLSPYAQGMNVRSVCTYVALGLLACTVCALAANRFVAFYAADFIVSDPMSGPRADVIVIPGAAVYQSGELTNAYLDRVKTAIALWGAGRADRVLVTGDGVDASHDEVTPVALLLEAAGVPSEAIMRDPEGLSTYESMRRAKEVHGITSAMIVTQPFHLPRSIFLARWFGIEAYGTPTSDWTGRSRDHVREYFATVKAVIEAFVGSM